MNNLFQLLLGLLGLTGIFVGAELVIRGSKNIALRLGISEFFVGLTVLSIGTSLPEIFTHLQAGLKILNSPGDIQVLSGLAVGTNVGSNIIQITFIVGIIGFFTTITTTKKFLQRDYLFMLFSILLLFFFSLNQHISRLEALFLVFLYLGYLSLLGYHEKIFSKLRKRDHIIKNSFLVIIGVALLAYCAGLILDSATFFAETYHIQSSLIGVLIIGVCTAMPELTTAIVGLVKKSPHLSLGTLVGSNITNPLLALGLGASISTYQIDRQILFVDLPFWFLVSLLGLFFFWKGLRLKRWEALVLVLVYILYVGLRLNV